MTFRRTAAHDTELGGLHITEGDKVIMFYSSANMDTEVFDHPEQPILSRHPNKHVAFGGVPESRRIDLGQACENCPTQALTIED